MWDRIWVSWLQLLDWQPNKFLLCIHFSFHHIKPSTLPPSRDNFCQLDMPNNRHSLADWPIYASICINPEQFVSVTIQFTNHKSIEKNNKEEMQYWSGMKGRCGISWFLEMLCKFFRLSWVTLTCQSGIVNAPVSRTVSNAFLFVPSQVEGAASLSPTYTVWLLTRLSWAEMEFARINKT